MLTMGIAQVVQGMAWVMGPAMVVLCIAVLLSVRDTIVCLAVLGVHLRFFITALGGVLIEMCRKLALELEHRLGISEKRWQLRCFSECLKKSDKPESAHQGFLKFEGLGHSEQTMFTVMLKKRWGTST